MNNNRVKSLLTKFFFTSLRFLKAPPLIPVRLKTFLSFLLQIKEVPNDFFVDIVSSNNFLVTILNQLFSFVRNSTRIDAALKSRVAKFQAHLSQKFNWIFDDEEDEEDKPVIVET